MVGQRLQTSQLVLLMTFLLLYVRAYVFTVRLDRFVGVAVEYWATTKKDPPVPATNSGYILLEEWEWRAPTGTRPQP
jgi:hypothetical protein